MPTKDVLSDDGKYYIDGIPMTLIEAIEVEDICTFDESIGFIATAQLDNEATFSAKISNKDRRNLLINVFQYPTNNWLKMHGYPMRRRKK